MSHLDRHERIKFKLEVFLESNFNRVMNIFTRYIYEIFFQRFVYHRPDHESHWIDTEFRSRFDSKNGLKILPQARSILKMLNPSPV